MSGTWRIVITSSSSAQFTSPVLKSLTTLPGLLFSAKAIRSFSVNQMQFSHGFKTWATRHHILKQAYQIGCLIQCPLDMKQQVKPLLYYCYSRNPAAQIRRLFVKLLSKRKLVSLTHYLFYVMLCQAACLVWRTFGELRHGYARKGLARHK